MMLKKYDLTGKTFGRLVVLERKGTDRNRVSVWLCKCSCGTEFPVTGSNLRHNVTQSCGCLQKESARIGAQQLKQINQKGYATAVRSMYYTGAKARNIPFDLTEDEVRFLITKNCYYCGAIPSRKASPVYDDLVNGIDRINSNDYYHMGNCVTCCTMCNRMKSDLHKDDFVAHIRRIAINMEYH